MEKTYKFLITTNHTNDLIQALEKMGISYETALKSMTALKENRNKIK